MKSGETRFIVKKLDTKKPYTSVGFRLSNGKTTIKKSTDAQETKDKVLVRDGVFLIPLQQADTNALQGNVTLEAQINYQDHSVIMSDDNFLYINSSLGYDAIQGSAPAEDDGIEVVMTAIEEGVAVIVNPEASQELIDAVTQLFQDTKDIAQSVRDDADNGVFDGDDGYSPQVTVKTETPSTYVLHIKDADHEYDTPNLQGQGGEGSIEVGDGLKREGNEISVDLSDDSNQLLRFLSNKLYLGVYDLGYNSDVRQALTESTNYPLASKSYVDDLISGTIHYLVVETLPTEDIDTHTIYLVPKSTSQTNNVYDEYMYINSAWELIGSTEVDLSNYYTKSEVYTKSETVTEINNRSNKVYPAIKRNDEISRQLSDYPDIKARDLIYNNTSIGDSMVFYVVNSVNTQTGIITFTKITQLRYVSGAPKTTIDVTGGDEEYYIDDIIFSDNGNIYRVLTKDLSDLPNISYTYQTYDGHDTKYSAGMGINIDSNNVISVTGGGGSYTFGNGLTESSGTVSVDVSDANSLLGFASGKLVVSRVNLGQDTVIRSHLVDTNYNNPLASKSYVDTGLGNKQDTIDSTHKLSADNVDDTSTTNKFVTSTEKSTWNGKADETTISTDTTSTTVSLTLADNHEYRYTQDLSSLTLTMPSGDFIASVVFASGSTPTSMTYDSSIKWSGDDVTSNAFVPVANKTYDIMFYYNGININAISRGAE